MLVPPSVHAAPAVARLARTVSHIPPVASSSSQFLRWSAAASPIRRPAPPNVVGSAQNLGPATRPSVHANAHISSTVGTSPTSSTDERSAPRTFSPNVRPAGQRGSPLGPTSPAAQLSTAFTVDQRRRSVLGALPLAR